MSQKGYEVLDSVVNNIGADYIDCVVSAKDINIKDEYYDKIKEVCSQSDIVFYDRNEEYILNSDYSFAVSWKWLIHSTQSKLVIFHDSILPKYRGFAPLVNSLVNGEKQVGVTALFTDKEYDKGDIIDQEIIDIQYPITIQECINKITKCYIDLVLSLVNKIISGENIVANKQDESLASYSLWRDEEDYQIDWSTDSTTIRRFIDSVGFPYNGASAVLDGKKVRILKAEEDENILITNRSIGKVVFNKEGYPVIVCGKGTIKILEMIDDETGESLLPLKKFRSRFK